MKKNNLIESLGQKLGHRKLFGIGHALSLLAIVTMPFINFAGNLKINFFILDFIVVFISAIFILSASDMKHKCEKKENE